MCVCNTNYVALMVRIESEGNVMHVFHCTQTVSLGCESTSPKLFGCSSQVFPVNCSVAVSECIPDTFNETLAHVRYGITNMKRDSCKFGYSITKCFHTSLDATCVFGLT